MGRCHRRLDGLVDVISPGSATACVSKRKLRGNRAEANKRKTRGSCMYKINRIRTDLHKRSSSCSYSAFSVKKRVGFKIHLTTHPVNPFSLSEYILLHFGARGFRAIPTIFSVAGKENLSFFIAARDIITTIQLMTKNIRGTLLQQSKTFIEGLAALQAKKKSRLVMRSWGEGCRVQGNTGVDIDAL